MVPLLVLLGTTALLRLVGAVAVEALDGWTPALRGGFAAMLVLTASAHFSDKRRDLVAMVPPALPRADLLVTVTGLLELVIAAGLVLEETAPWVAAALAVLLVAMFPANVHAARVGVGIGGRPATPLGLRSLIQAVFVAAAVVVVA